MLSSSVQPLELENQYTNPNNKKQYEIRDVYFCRCIRPVLLCCKWIGFLPLNGLESTNDPRFSWKSAYTLIYVPNIIWTIVYVMMKCFYRIAHGFGRNDISGFIFSLNTILSSLFLFKLSMTWNETLSKIQEVESLVPFLKCYKPMKIIKWMLVVILLTALMEFTTYMINMTYSVKDLLQNESDYCSQIYFVRAYDWFFSRISFHCALGYILVISKLQAVCLRNITDVFIISVTVFLSSQFTHFNTLLHKEEKKSKRTGWMPWSKLQRHYTQLTRLVMLLDELINPFIFVSFTCNLLFTCKQIFIIIQAQQATISIQNETHKNSELLITSRDWEPALYLTFSTAFVIVRATIVSLLLAHYHTLTRKPLRVLHTVAASAYNLKMQRFMDQVFHSKLSLSGYKFFYVTRGSIISMIATLITYELVLLQFPERSQHKQ